MTETVYTTPSGRFRVDAELDDDAENPWKDCDTGFEYHFEAGRYISDISKDFPMDCHPGGPRFKAGHPDYWWYPVYAYIHSGITVSLSPFSCRWDSGVLGWVAVKRPSRGGEWRRQKDFLKYLQGMIDVYDDYLTGNVYGYLVVDTKTGDELDSCWGYYGNDHEKSGLLEAGKAQADYYESQLEICMNTRPVHDKDTLYPFFWVTAVVQIEEPDSPGKFYYRDAETDDDATHFGVYRYNPPGADGISVCDHICDCPTRPVAERIRDTLDLLRNSINGILPWLPEETEAKRKNALSLYQTGDKS